MIRPLCAPKATGHPRETPVERGASHSLDLVAVSAILIKLARCRLRL